jgi:TetR/AcrR family transcriptional repressor of nem operon
MNTSTRTSILHEASKMLLIKGFHGFSLQELADSLSIKKSSLYHHYSSKNQLAIELYRFYQDAFNDWTMSCVNTTPEKAILKYCDKLIEWICEKNRICPLSALSLEWAIIDKDIQKEVLKLHELHQDWISSLYKKMEINISSKEATSITLSLLQGSIQLARLTGDHAIVRKNLKNFIKSIKK